MNEFIMQRLLTLILFAPVVGMVAVMLVPSERKQAVRWVSLVASLVPFGLSVLLWVNFDNGATGFQFEEQAEWYTVIRSSYHLGVDGISVPMILLTTLLTPLGILTSFGIQDLSLIHI